MKTIVQPPEQDIMNSYHQGKNVDNKEMKNLLFSHCFWEDTDEFVPSEPGRCEPDVRSSTFMTEGFQTFSEQSVIQRSAVLADFLVVNYQCHGFSSICLSVDKLTSTVACCNKSNSKPA